MAVKQSSSFGDALCTFSNVTGINEKTREMFKFILKRKGALGLLPTRF